MSQYELCDLSRATVTVVDAAELPEVGKVLLMDGHELKIIGHTSAPVMCVAAPPDWQVVDNIPVQRLI